MVSCIRDVSKCCVACHLSVRQMITHLIYDLLSINFQLGAMRWIGVQQCRREQEAEKGNRIG